MLTSPFQRCTAAIFLMVAVCACSRGVMPAAIVSLSPQTTAVVHQMGAADLMLTRTGGARDLSGEIAVRTSEWLRREGHGTLLIFGIEHDAPDLPAAIAGDSRIKLALFPGCNIIDVFNMYQEIGDMLAKPEVAAAHIRSISSELGRISGATLGLPRPSVMVADWHSAAYSGVGLVGDMIEIGGGEHLLEFAGPPCSSVDRALWDGPPPQIVLDARRDAQGVLSPLPVPPVQVVQVPDLLRKLENLELLEAAREVRSALFPESKDFEFKSAVPGGSGVPPR